VEERMFDRSDLTIKGILERAAIDDMWNEVDTNGDN
jgi:hypothetical protein